MRLFRKTVAAHIIDAFTFYFSGIAGLGIDSPDLVQKGNEIWNNWKYSAPLIARNLEM